MEFDNNFLKKKILMISDFDDSYSKEEKDLEDNYIETLKAQIATYGVTFEYEEVKTENDLEQLLTKYNKDEYIIFNWCERLNQTDGTEALVTDIYSKHGFTFTGGNSRVLRLLSNKFECISMLEKAGISVPKTYFVKKEEYKEFKCDFSKLHIVKSNEYHASIGISKNNLVRSMEEYLVVAKNYAENLKTDMVVQEYIEGSEYTALLWGNETPEVLPILHLNFGNKSGIQIFTEDGKFEKHSDDYINVPYTFLSNENNEILEKKIENVSTEAYKKLALIDYARMDFRVSSDNIYIIDVNANPYINILQDCEVYLCSEKIGYNWGQTILKICEFAYLRELK